jgi:hypothetical protein
MFKLKKIRPLSLAKVSTIALAIFGLIMGIFYALLGNIISKLPAEALAQAGISSEMGFLFGPVAIIILPIVYAIMGFITGLIGAWIYNLAAKWVGGIEIDLVK